MHTVTDPWYAQYQYSIKWLIYDFLRSICYWTVPVFIMISGSLFLDRDISIKKIYSKYILKIFTVLLFWSCLYLLVTSLNILEIKKFLSSSFHLWYLYMIIGLYMIVPFIKEIVKREVLLKYFLILGFVINFLFIHDINIYFQDNNFLGIIKGFVFFFVLGFYLNKKFLNKNILNYIYFLGIISFIINFILSVSVSYQLDTKVENYIFSYFNIFTFFESIAVFLFFKSICSKINFSENFKKIIYTLSKYTLGVYCVHKLLIDNISYNEYILVKTLLVIILSFGISAILNKIPALKKYIV